MQNFKSREDRFHFFESFENPLINICYELELPDFRPYCKKNNLPVFHTFLYALSMSLNQIDNFKYRIYQKEVIKIDEFKGSYTVINSDNLFNYTRYEFHAELKTFIAESLKARDEATSSSALMNTGIELSERELKNYVFITSLPWLKFTSIQHPVYKFKSADIPSLAWGKFTEIGNGKIVVPFSVQAHHGFVDGYHIHQLGEILKETLTNLTK